MKTSKKTLLLTILSVSFLMLLSFQSMRPEEEDESDSEDIISTYEEFPPLVDSFWVQKLVDTLPDGSNMRICIKYIKDSTMADTIKIFYSDDSVVFRDNGTNADTIANDSIYCAFVKENISEFVSELQGIESLLNDKGYYYKFTGHSGEKITALPAFDFDAFGAGALSPIDIGNNNGPSTGIWWDPCDDFLKQNSLFITDLSVVEDYSGNRSYRVTDGTGNATGLYTFGNLIKNIANTTATNGVKNFLKDWLKNWTNTSLTVNGQAVNIQSTTVLNENDRMNGMVEMLIKPWLVKCGVVIPSGGDIDLSNWETIWDNDFNATEEKLLQYAPFKLTTIANRLDLRGNAAYKTGVTDAGETRFIFTLVYPFASPALGGNNTKNTSGNPSIRYDQNNPYGNFVDWVGLNIIFEYGNIQTNECDLKSFAQSWRNLSSLTLGSSTYNAALASITSTVINANAAPTRINGSAINRIRTNERIFSVSQGFTSWSKSPWQFRQFELDASTHKLKQVPLTNTPRNDANFAWNTYHGMTNSSRKYSPSSTNSARDNLLDYVFLSNVTRNLIYRGTHKLPVTYPSSTDYMLAATANVSDEYVHYWDLQWNRSTTKYDYTAELNTSNPVYYKLKQTRQQFSLNTCQGCHAGETKTVFTHVRPLGYGQSANYWDNTSPDYLHEKEPLNVGDWRTVDGRFANNAEATGTSTDYNYVQPNSSGNVLSYFPNVSAFLTGRNITGYASGNPSFDDDDNGDSDDNTLSGLYYVNDPSNQVISPYGWTVSSNTYQLPEPNDKKWGYNDLERRKIDLCALINHNCETSVVMEILFKTTFGHIPE